MKLKRTSKLLALLLAVLMVVSLLPAAALAEGSSFDVTFAVEGGITGKTFTVQQTNAADASYTDQQDQEIEAGTKLTFTPRPNYASSPNVFRIKSVNTTFVDTDDYEFKGFRVTVGETTYAELLPSQVEEGFVYQVADEIEIQVAKTGNLTFRAASCEKFSAVTITAVYEKKQAAEPTFDVTFAVEGGITGKTFTVQQTNAADASYTDQPDQEVTAGTKLTFTPRPNYASSPNVFRIKSVNTTFVDTDDYEFKGFRVTVGEMTYAELLPSQVEEGFVYQVADEIEIQVAKTGNLTFRAASCEKFSAVTITAVYEKKQAAEPTFDVTFAVEGLDEQTFSVTKAVNGDYSGQTAEEIAAGTKVTFTPPAQYDNMPNVFRIMGMNDSFVDTEEYTYKGIRIEVDGTEYAEYIPADLSELDVAEIYEIGEIELQFGNTGNGHLMFRAESCNGFDHVVLTAVYEKKQPTVAVESIELNKSTTTIKVGESEALTATVLPENATDKAVTWTSSNPDVATVEAGVVMGVAAGEATITATAGGKSEECIVTVETVTSSIDPLILELSSDNDSANAMFEYAVYAILTTSGPDQEVAQKGGITEKETANISLNGHENDKYQIRITVLEHNQHFKFSGWTINGASASGFEQAGFSIEVGDSLLITVPVSKIMQMDERKLVIVATFETASQTDTGPFGDFAGDTLVYRTGLNHTFEGQRTAFESIPFQFSRACSNVVLKAYYGENTNGAAFYEEEIGEVAAQTCYYTVVAPAMQKVNKITLEITADGADPVTKTYDVTVKDSGEIDMDWMTPPTDGTGYPSECKTAITGPNIYDSAAFIDPATGETKLYFAVSGGVMQYSGGSMVSMDGIRLGYHDNEYASGYALAIGGENANKLAAFVKSSGQSDTQASYYIAYCNDNGTWEKAGNSDLSQVFYPAALVLSQDSIWVSDQHWNGTSWTPNTVTFNSFWKSSGGTAYAGSANGIYKYASGEWTLVSGTSGTMFISSGYRSSTGDVTLITASAYEIERASQWHNMSGTVQKVVISGTTASTSAIDISGLTNQSYQVANKHTYVGITNKGAIYGITDGPVYDLSSFTSYYASWLFAYDNGAWVYQNVDAFNNATDKANIEAGKLLGSIETPKQQPDGIRRIENPIEGVTIFAGQGGGNYIMFGTATISFESNGGSAVAPLTATIGSHITPPTSPTRDGYTFVGWYTMENFMNNGTSYAFSVMPAKNLTLYAKWIEKSGGGSSSDPFAAEREKAQTSLDTALSRLTQSDYDSGVWAQIQSAYNTGTANIAAAEDYDGIYAALNAAVDAINELAKNVSGTITVAVTVEKLTIDGEYIIEPTLVECEKYERASVVVTDLLKAHYPDYPGKPYTMTGTETENFYLSGVWDGSTMQSEFDHGIQSGWMYCVNGSFPGVGASAWTLNNGDVMRWQYTCEGLGSDIGADNSAWGNDDSVTVADKDALIWKIAEINQAGTQSTYGNDYTDAMTVLKNITASQTAVDNALAALNAVDNPGSGNTSSTTTGTTTPAAESEEAAVEVKPEVTDGEASAEVSAETVADALKDSEDADALTVKVETEDADSVELALPADAVKAAAEAEVGLNVETENGTVKLDADTLGELAESGKDVAVTVSANEDGTTTIDVTADGESVDARVKVELPAAEDNQVLVIVNPDGTEEIVKKSLVEDGKAYAEIPAGATVKVVENDKEFGDVKGDEWYAEAVGFLASHELFQGTNNGFEPGLTMNRAMLATVLYRLEDAAATGESSFDDVDPESWYADAAAWAEETGIINGTDKGFEPNAPVTREQIATMLYRYANLIGLDTAARGELDGFTDGGDTANWAKDAMEWAVSVGLFQGNDDGTLNPKGDATRAEVATLFERMIKLIVK